MAADIDVFLVEESAAGDATGVAVDKVVLPDGTTADLQICKFAVGANGEAFLVSPANPLDVSDATLLALAQAAGLNVRDASAPWTSVNSGGVNIVSSQVDTIAPANTARQQVTVMNAADPSTGGTVWLGIGRSPTVGQGVFLAPGGVMDIPCQQEIQGIAASGAALMTFEEWAA